LKGKEEAGISRFFGRERSVDLKEMGLPNPCS